MKFISTLLIIVMFFMFIACGPQKSKTDNTETANMNKTEKEDPGKMILEENKLKPLVTIENPNTMKVEASPRNQSEIDAEVRMGKAGAEKFLEYISKNGIDMAVEEVNKAKDGAFKDYIPDNHFYLAVFKKTGDKGLTIIAHGLNRDYIGVEILSDQWAGLTGWLYWKTLNEKYEETKSNSIMIDKVYWKDPVWANGKVSRFTAYDRYYTINNQTYLWHYCTWLDE